MPGRLFLSTPAKLPGRDDEASMLVAEPARHNIAPGQQILTRTRRGYAHMRWGIIPVGRVNARGRPVMETLINARSETVFEKSAYADTGRAVVPANGWYEWTGEKRRKTAWRIGPKSGGFLWFAAITDVWQAPGGLKVPQVATITCPPNEDVAPIHHRMGVLLSEQDIALWLEGAVEEVTPLMRPWPKGLLAITQAEDVDWDAP